VRPGHPHIHQHDVGPGQLDLAHRGLAVGCLADHLEPVQGVEQRAQPAPDHGVVVGQHDAQRVHVLIMAGGGSRWPGKLFPP
jgi:hypothetical protein